ncbi:MAG: ArsA-related P-loop ATPase, partial [Ilumatobacteraceae bacterium]
AGASPIIGVALRRRRVSGILGVVREVTGGGWITDARVAVVAGKGGVGSTTVAAAMALAAARDGADVLFVSVDGRPGVGPLLGGAPLTERAAVLCDLSGAGRVRGRTIPASGAFADYLELKKVPRLVRRAASAASLDMIAAATPGLEHLLVLGKIKELERTGEADLLIVDAPPAGHAAPFLRSPRALLDVVTDGAVREQAEEVSAMLADPARTQGVIVTLPEETPVNEAIELDRDLRDELHMRMGPLVVNACWPDRAGLAVQPRTAAKRQGVSLPTSAASALAGSVAFGRARLTQQREQLARLDAAIGSSWRVLTRLPVTRITPEHLRKLADELTAVAA